MRESQQNLSALCVEYCLAAPGHQLVARTAEAEEALTGENQQGLIEVGAGDK